MQLTLSLCNMCARVSDQNTIIFRPIETFLPVPGDCKEGEGLTGDRSYAKSRRPCVPCCSRSPCLATCRRKLGRRRRRLLLLAAIGVMMTRCSGGQVPWWRVLETRTGRGKPVGGSCQAVTVLLRVRDRGICSKTERVAKIKRKVPSGNSERAVRALGRRTQVQKASE